VSAMPVSLPESALRLPLVSNDDSAVDLHGPIEALFEELHDRLLRYVLCLGLSPQDGEEIIQETFLALFVHLRKGRSRENLRGWTFRVTHNLGLKRRASNRRKGELPYEGLFAELRADPNPSPEERYAGSQRASRLRAVVRALSAQDQCCLHLRAEGLRYREIAATVGISLGSVAASLERAFERLNRVDER